MLGFVAQQAGLPLDLVALLLGVRFIGKANTPVNALGRLACVAALIPRKEPGEPGAAFKASG
jgi:Na+/H+-dicarboxylate symporter